MKKIFVLLPALLFINIIIWSCAGNPGHSRKPFSTVEIIPSGKKYVLNQSVTFRVVTRFRSGPIKSINLFLNDKLLTTSTLTEFTYTYPVLDMTGLNTIRVVAEGEEGIPGIRIQNFTVLSDTAPVKLGYSVVKQLPHPPEYFTQGLEIHNGFLYEGTGDYGKSALYKTSVVNDKILLSKKLPSNYFGEGITILNDKLYQLTYKNKIGFVYNLSDFALVDSFRFNSNEGWGLTNDGKHLIMSDGTGTLTWINPSGFSVVKKIQVADNQKIYQYLNELEYDNGDIWANVWTSGQIVRIDPSSGKIKGYLDLSGIISMLPGAQTEKIDVMNGIAVVPGSGHLLITGKLWPQMFEIKVTGSE